MNLEQDQSIQTPMTPLTQWLITITVMLVAIIEVLDITIVNVALPHMMGSLGATSDQITWVLTSYIVSAAIVMPLTGLLVKRIGRRRLLLINILGFLIASALCGLSQSLTSIVFFRVMQGLFGASLVPLSQYILRDTFPIKEQAKAMAIWGMGIMVAPVLGPTLGGTITEILNWRWIFYINIPFCAAAFLMAVKLIKETPRQKTHIDWLGLTFMALWVGLLQIILDRGNSSGWFNSSFIFLTSLICLFSFIMFIIRSLNTENPIINLRLFADKQFLSSNCLILFYCCCILGIIAMQPLMLEILFGYPAQTTGLVMAPRGLACAIAMFVCARLMNIIDYRYIIAFGLFCSMFGSYLMSRYSIFLDIYHATYPGILQGIGMGFFFVPVSTYAFNNLSETVIAEASGLFSFSRSLGTSIGVSICSTILSRQTQMNWHELSKNIKNSSAPWQQWLQAHHFVGDSPLAIKMIAKEILRQAQFIAFIDIFFAAGLSFLICLPFLFFLSCSHKTTTT